MKNEIGKAKHVKPIHQKLWKFYLQVLTDASVKIAILEIFSEKCTREVFERNISEGALGKINQKNLSRLADLG